MRLDVGIIFRFQFIVIYQFKIVASSPFHNAMFNLFPSINSISPQLDLVLLENFFHPNAFATTLRNLRFRCIEVKITTETEIKRRRLSEIYVVNVEKVVHNANDRNNNCQEEKQKFDAPTRVNRVLPYIRSPQTTKCSEKNLRIMPRNLSYHLFSL